MDGKTTMQTVDRPVDTFFGAQAPSKTTSSSVTATPISSSKATSSSVTAAAVSFSSVTATASASSASSSP